MIRYMSARKRVIAFFCLALFSFQLFQPTVALALTSGPSQPEVQSFQPAGTTEMVDLFSGDFSYNIPLFELPGPNGGYPFNLSYQAGIGMDQEASWVGLGWSLNPGTITRQMRGLPDDFNGELIKTKMSVKPSVTVGLGAGVGLELFGSDALSLQVGFSVNHNSYKGFGYSIDGSLGFERSVGSGMTGGLGLGFNLDSNEGVNLQPSLSLGNKTGEGGIGAGYNSRTGLTDISFRHSLTTSRQIGRSLTRVGLATSASLSLAHPGYTPQVSMPMNNLNLSAEFRPGGSWWGIFPNLYIRGFYSEQRLDKDSKLVSNKAYGYLNYQHANESDAIMDFNREKDGMVTKESPNLAIPSLSYDIYSVTGQGIAAMYRPMRNDFGLIHDQETSSVSNGASVGVDIGPAATHVGVNLTVNHSTSTSGPWTSNNQMEGPARFQGKLTNDVYEPWYFKVHGEPNAEAQNVVADIGGDKAVRVQISPDNFSPTANATIENRDNFQKTFTSNSSRNRNRKNRNQVIQPITNEQLLSGNLEMLPEFRITYLNNSGTEVKLNRASYPDNHIAGFSALTPEGLQYNYALPAYNKKQIEVTFSAQGTSSQQNRVAVGPDSDTSDPVFKHTGTDEFLKSTEIPEYTHSHLLTSILGPDYVDVGDDGVTDDDLGYWVKFTYEKKSSSYEWRDPFSKAHHQQGWRTNLEDDKGSFVYGVKELWYLKKAETKTHVAIFNTALRTDGKGAQFKIQNNNSTGESVYKLTDISLYSRATGPSKPIKVVRFCHDYSLCTGLENSAGTDNALCDGFANATGKLTLRKLWFEYGGSTRGSLNPYQFDYSTTNPSYNNLAIDRWGNYKPYVADLSVDFPYVPQTGANAGTDANTNASAWSLNKITLPSGAEVIIDYESDDYGYVQHKPAMQMLEVVSAAGPVSGTSFELFDNVRTASLSDDFVKVRFKLESQIAATISDPQIRANEVRKYLDVNRKQIYFKLLMQLHKPGKNLQEYISGYADVETNTKIGSAFTMGLEDANGNQSAPYDYGYFHVKTEKGNGNKRHPFSMRAWQHLRTNQPELAREKVKVQQTNDEGTRIAQIKSLGSIGADIRQMFQGFYDYCHGEGFGRHVAKGKSWIRMNCPDKIKYGGGLRVRQITMKDKWAEDEEGIYGQVYEYRMMEDGKSISSGVASYEPLSGGDENPLRYAKKYVQSVPLRADNNLFFEYPINETYYPGPQVGYRKVTVWSLPSAHLSGLTVKNMQLSNGNNLFPAAATNLSFGTSGKTEHEFYTAKDFPVITDETDKTNRPYKLTVPVPFLGSISISKLTASQGYSIVTNDMHGKPKKVSNYRQDKTGIPEAEPISWIKYNYRSEEKIYDNEKVNVLINSFKDNGSCPGGDNTLGITSPCSTAADFTIGQETELFTDMRQYEDKAWIGGARVNLDIVYVPIFFVVVPIPVTTIWPSISNSEKMLRTSVTNKVIFKSGILESTEAFDGGSRIVTRNVKWDKLTGTPVLTIVNNNFDAPVYNYSILAHSQYEGMGAASQNIGLAFDITTVTKDPVRANYYDFFTQLPESRLYPGDELLLYESLGTAPVGSAIYMGNIDGDKLLYSKQELVLQGYTCLIVRSGFRNQLAVSAGSLTALTDPSVKGTEKLYTGTITIVK
jgi:hypothetical protein